MKNTNTKTLCISRTTPRPTALNFNPLLWRLFDQAAIPMPAAEAYEYAVIEQEEAEKKVLAALLAERGV